MSWLNPTDLINRDFGTLSDLSEGELSVVCRPSESHLEGKESEWVNILVFNLDDNIVSQHEADPELLNMHLRPVVVNKV